MATKPKKTPAKKPAIPITQSVPTPTPAAAKKKPVKKPAVESVVVKRRICWEGTMPRYPGSKEVALLRVVECAFGSDAAYVFERSFANDALDQPAWSHWSSPDFAAAFHKGAKGEQVYR